MSAGRKTLRFAISCFVIIGLAIALMIHQRHEGVRAAQGPPSSQKRRQSMPLHPGTPSSTAPNAPSATITVNSLTDGAPANNGQCTLREALINANANNQSGSTDCSAGGGADIIVINLPGTINLVGALQDITDHLIINGTGASTSAVRRDTGGNYGIFQVNFGVAATLSGLTVTNGATSIGGGVNNSGNLTINDCAFTANTASINGGGINNFGVLTINRSTISANSAGDGGGLFNQNPGTAELTNCTISGNTATGLTGGITNVAFGAPTPLLTLLNCTVTGNTGPTEGGIATVDDNGTSPAITRLKNTIVANNSTPNLNQSGASAQVISQGNNLASDNGSGLLTASGDLINLNPLLAPLGDYGGQTQTHLLLADSPARNLGNNPGAPATDQRGVTRPVSGVVDIGAVENDVSLTITPAVLPNNPLNQPYSQQLSVGGSALWTISSGNLPTGVMLNSATGLISGTTTANGVFNFTVIATMANGSAGVRTYSVIAGTGGGALQFYPLPAPVRLLETRTSFSACTNTGAPINANGTLTVSSQSVCTGIPVNAAVITGNVTVVPSAPGFITLYPSDATQPTVANSNFNAGEITNNVFTVGLGATGPDAGAFKIFASATTHVIVDVTGYYAPPGTGGLYFHPLTNPVRLLETRTGFNGCIAPGAKLIGTGNPSADPNLDLELPGRSPIATPCNSIPATAQVLVGNATSVLPTGSGYLTIYPSGSARPTVASSNYAGNDVINGPFAVRLGTDGKFKVYTFATTDLVIDIIGYYSTDATDANGVGLFFNQIAHPVRLLETRSGFSGCVTPGIRLQSQTTLYTVPAAITCEGISFSTARAIVGNATVVTPDNGGFMTFFPFGQSLPTIATSNFVAGGAYNRHFFVGLDAAQGRFSVFLNMNGPQFTTDLVIDVSGYFAP
jgi:CSLREA domain-containing protein